MKINISNIREVHGLEETFSFIFEKTEDIEGIAFNKQIEVFGKVINTGNDIEVRAHVNAEVATECNRCLDKISLPINFDFVEVIEENSDVVQDELLDLDAVVIENIIVNIPMRVVCSEDCPGLCPMCGHNLKEGPCDCKNENIDPRLAVLKRLKDGNK